MKQVIRWLRMGLAAPTKTERQWLGITPLDRPTDDDAIRRVVLLLEAVETAFPDNIQRNLSKNIGMDSDAILRAALALKEKP